METDDLGQIAECLILGAGAPRVSETHPFRLSRSTIVAVTDPFFAFLSSRRRNQGF